MPSDTETKTCKRCDRAFTGEQDCCDAGMTNCLHCGADICGDCSMLESEDLVSENLGSVCFEWHQEFVLSVEKKNATVGEVDAAENPAERHILQGTVSNYLLEQTGIAEPIAFTLEGVTGDVTVFRSTDWDGKDRNACLLEPHTAWKPLLGRRVEISCRLTTVQRERESPRGNPYWVDEPLLSKVKVLRILDGVHDA